MKYDSQEYKAAFEAYIRTGDERGLQKIAKTEGGFPMPADVEEAIDRKLADASPIRAISSATKNPNPVLLSLPKQELYAMPAATAPFLSDPYVDIGQWIADGVTAAFAEQETAAFINGDGTDMPTGFLQVDSVLESERRDGQLGYVIGNLGNDTLIDLVYALKSGYRQNASWVMNRRTQATIRKLKDVDGNYIWQPAATAGGRASLMGFDLVEAEDMPDVAADATAIAFGDFRRGYLIVDLQGVNVLRDPFSSKPYVLFYTTKRVGGGVADFDAIKLLKVADGSQ